jgi:adenosine deaminase
MSESTGTPDFAALPKVDLHRHLEGSLRLETLRELSGPYGIDLPPTPDLSHLVQMQPDDRLDFATFLSKFQTLRRFYLSPEIIRRVVAEAVEDAALDGVRYLELRFTPVALARARSFPLGEVMDWVIESSAQASTACTAAGRQIVTRLIASVNRHESPTVAAEVAGLAAERRQRGIVALDLAGNEAEFPAEPFRDLFQRTRKAGLALTVHAGEWGPASNVREALEVLQANRIAHGVRILEDPEVVAIARERGTPFEVCITSNFQTGVVPGLGGHPFVKMLDCGLNVLLCTDDPSISAIRLSDEYRAACLQLGLSRERLEERILAAARASFLPDAEKARLVADLQRELNCI